jgi:hypothetical protein
MLMKSPHLGLQRDVSPKPPFTPMIPAERHYE